MRQCSNEYLESFFAPCNCTHNRLAPEDVVPEDAVPKNVTPENVAVSFWDAKQLSTRADKALNGS